jgi:hypothetical protein
MNFPQYRKYNNNQSYFKIISETEIVELKIFGKFYELHHIQAKILPERIMIADLLIDYKNFALEINESEFEEQLNYCKMNVSLLK